MRCTFNNKMKWRLDEDTGYLRVTANIVKAGVMQYHRSELLESGVEIPAHIVGEYINVLLPQDSIADKKFLTSIEGTDVTRGHVWQGGETRDYAVGSIAGTAKVKGDYVQTDFVLKDKSVITDVMTKRLVENSGGYTGDIIFESGLHGDMSYDAIQTNLRYNHTALLQEGHGRAGRDVKIINSKGKPMTTQKVRLMNSGVTVNVADDSVQAVEQLDQKLSGMVDKSELEQAQNKITELETTNRLKDEELAALKAKDNSAEIAQAIEERAQAEKVAEAHGVKVENMGYGADVKAQVVKAIRIKNSLPFTDEDASNPVIVETFFRGYAEQVPVQEKKAPPRFENAAPSQQPSAAEMINKLYFGG